MSKADTVSKALTLEKASLRRRIRSFYRCYNQGAWPRCYAHLDPTLQAEGKVHPDHYADSLAAFKQAYGSVDVWYVRLSLHLNEKKNKHDTQPFAYAYVFWQDDNNDFHVFRERWVQRARRWYTRVAGLVARNKPVA
jgi:hypothetical protein